MKTTKAERELALDFLRVTEAAAIESAKTMGQGDRKHSDHVAVEAMREVMDTVPMRGRIDSLNVSATAAVFLYEILQQRLDAST